MHLKTILLISIMATAIGCNFAGSGFAQDTAKATGYVHVQQIEGKWWFIGPDGDKFVSIGVNHIESHLWLARYNKAATHDEEHIHCRAAR
jgi:hypothetical protein